jgi:endonuclease YncB( thermonuclease family)
MSYPFVSDQWRAQPVYVVDGDTVDLFIDRAMHEYGLYRFRIFGIDTPELRDRDEAERVKAKEAKEAVQEMLDRYEKSYVVDLKDWPLRVKTYKDPDSFGRWLAEVFFTTDDGEEKSLAGELLRLELAEVYDR